MSCRSIRRLFAVAASLITVETATGQSVFVERYSNAAGGTLRGFAASEDVLITVGDGGRVLRSLEGVSWTGLTAGVNDSLSGVAYGNGGFVAVGERGRIAMSLDGLSWTTANSGIDVSLNAVTFGGGRYVAVGDNGTILTSTDAVNWTVRNSGETASLRGVGWMSQSAVFVAVGDRGVLLSSDDGSIWTPRSSGTDDDLLNVAAGHVFFYVGGRGGVYSGTTTLFARENGTGSGSFRGTAMQPGSGPIALAVGDGGVAAANRGDPWRKVVSGTTTNLTAAGFVQGTFFAFGERETILQSLPDAAAAQRFGIASEFIRNLSNRAQAGAESGTLVSGFVIAGSGTKRVLVRASGPMLATFVVSRVLTQPTLTIFDAEGRVIGRNTGWGGNGDAEQTRAMTRLTGAFLFPEGSADSALLLSLAPGAYNAQVSGPATGIGLVEFYDTEYWPEISTSRLINLSSRCLVGNGEANAIMGVVLPRGRKLLIRAVGPGLARFGVDGVMLDPLLHIIVPQSGSPRLGIFPARTMAENDNWNSETRFLINPASVTAADEVREAAIAAGAFPLDENSKDAAMLLTLNNAGSYTVNVSGADGGGGVVLVEIYDLGEP